MNNLDEHSDADLQTLRASSQAILRSVVAGLDHRPEMQEAVRQLMTPDDMLEAFSQIGVADPDLARLTLQAAVAALVNAQSVEAIDRELIRRAGCN